MERKQKKNRKNLEKYRNIKTLKVDEKDVSYFRMLFYIPRQTALIILAAICSICAGSISQIFALFFGELFNVFLITDPARLEEEARKIIIIFVGIGVGALIFFYASHILWAVIGNRITRKLRLQFIESLLHQEVSYFDTHNTGEITMKLNMSFGLVVPSLNSTPNQVLSQLSTLISGFVIAFLSNWKMTLVMLSITPLTIACIIVQSRLFRKLIQLTQQATSEYNQVLIESVGGVRTIISFVAENHFTLRFLKHIDRLHRLSINSGHLNGGVMGIMQFATFISYAVGFWYAVVLILAGELQPGSALSVFLSSYMAAANIGALIGQITEVTKAKVAARGIFEVINKNSAIDPNVNGEVITDVKSEIECKNLAFHYPSRPSAPVLKNFSIKVTAGQRIAFVGKSGSGKSTIINLIQRFYDPNEGAITIDGVDHKSLNLHSLRSLIGVVSQEPTLFSGTIEDNIRLGSPDATDQQIIEAAKVANAHDFVSKLQDGYKTEVGEKGVQLSGGQKQRIAIARAIIRDPKILLLDEATSALDSESERLVQTALDRASEGRTSIIIAHRLSTIRNVDQIFVMVEGAIVESGTHEQLLENKSIYAQLVQDQNGDVSNAKSKKKKKNKITTRKENLAE